MSLVTAQAFYRVYDDAGVPLAEGSQNGTALTDVMVFTNSTGGSLDRMFVVHHGLDGYPVKYGAFGTLPPDKMIEARWVELYGYTAGTVHPGHKFAPFDILGNLSLNDLQCYLIGVPANTTYRGTLVVQKLHSITQ